MDIKNMANQSTRKKKFPKCTDILLQCFFFLYSHYQMVNIVHIVQKKFSLPCGTQLECYFNL